MRVTEPQLRAVLLAQSLEHIDTARTLVSQTEWDEATRGAVDAAHQRGAQRVGVGDVVLERAQTVAARAGGRNATVAALRQPGAGWHWAARGLPLLALLLGLATDRIANAHRVDLLSPPLLLVLAWNLAVYLLIAWQALRPATHAGWLQGLRPSHLQLRLHRTGRGRGLGVRIVADFQQRWWAHAADLTAQRTARVLHLCAAAWGAGIALSLLLRGLVVRYQFGWESTFLDATQVHAIVSALFWPLTALFGLAPFSLQEIAATQNFAGEGAAGGRWVWMYVGLLALVVMLPRIALASAARWREARWHGRIDLDGPAFAGLRSALPGDLWIGLHGPLADVLQGAAVQTPQGDRLQFAHARQPVDAVLAWDTGPVPPAWATAPQLALRWEDFGASWVLEPALFDRLLAALPTQVHAVQRLRSAWVERNEQRFGRCLQALAQHLQACAQLPPGDTAQRYAELVEELDAALRTVHPLPATSTMQDAPPAPHETGGRNAHAPSHPAPRRADRTALAVGTSAGAAAGAAAGAKAGALIDIGTGGLTLGAGTALGALLGGTTAWALRSLQKRGDADELLRRATEAACTHYLVIAHQQRVPPADAADLGAQWRAEVTGTVAAHADNLVAALKRGPDSSAAVLPLLESMLRGILRRSFAAASAERPQPGP